MSRRHAFWVVAYAFIVTLLGSTLPTPLYVVYQNRWHFSAGVLTSVYAVYALAVFLALLLFGSLSDQIGRRYVLLASLVLVAISAILFTFAQGVAWLVMARIVTGLAVGLSMGTATAALTELHVHRDNRYAALISTTCSAIGFGLGPLLAGILVQYAPWPTTLVYLVYLVLILLAFFGLWMIPETLPASSFKKVWRPQRPSIPAEIWAPFALASAAVFCGFATLGLFAALAPSLVISLLHVHNLAVGGAIASVVFATSALTQIALRQMAWQPALAVGLVVMTGGLILTVFALAMQSLIVFLGSAVCLGLGQGLSYMGSLALVNQIAPPAKRAEIASSYFVAAYIGTAGPVLGVGILASRLGFLGGIVAFVLLIGSISLVAVASMLLGAKRRYIFDEVKDMNER